MYSSLISMVAAGFMATAIPEPQWQPDYKAAREVGEQLQKPMAIVIGAGADGWKRVLGAADTNADAFAALRERYVCVYVDSTTPEGAKTARVFEMAGRGGLVLSDRSRTNQAYRHVGELSADQMSGALVKADEAGSVAKNTMSNEAPAKPAPATQAPVQQQYAPQWQGGCPGGNCGGGGCPGGNCGGGGFGRRR